MDVSKHRGTTKSSILNRVFHYKPSILGAHPYFWKHHTHMFTFNFLHGCILLIQTPWRRCKGSKMTHFPTTCRALMRNPKIATRWTHVHPQPQQQKTSKPHKKFGAKVSIPILVQRLKRRRLFSVFIIAWRNRSRVAKGFSSPGSS